MKLIIIIYLFRIIMKQMYEYVNLHLQFLWLKTFHQFVWVKIFHQFFWVKIFHESTLLDSVQVFAKIGYFSTKNKIFISNLVH